MVERFDQDARWLVLSSAAEEATRRGDGRVGTDHLLLALLHDPRALAARTLGVDLEAARVASEGLDRAALRAIGVDLASAGPPVPVLTRRRPRLTSGGRAALKRAVDEAQVSKSRRITARHLLVGLLAGQPPDPAAELLRALGIDASEARARLR